MRAVLTRVPVRVLVAAATAALLTPASPASAVARGTAEARVTVANGDGAAAVDPTYATTVTVRGQGFQSVKGGHGGIYVFFGTVRSGWKPSQGGQTGRDYFYVPDSESRDNQGYQRYIAFPGSDTASSAAGTMSADGAWSTTLVVPGAVFQAVDRNGKATSIDCREVTCGVITVGAHGIVNAHNETFRPVRVENLYADDAATASPSATPPATDGPTDDPAIADPASADPGQPSASAASPTAPAVLEVDRGSAHPGNVLAFAATGLAAGSQVSAVLDDGAAGTGPFLVGADGGVAGVVTIPPDTEVGTHELRLFGAGAAPAVSFAVTASAEAVDVGATAATGEVDGVRDRWAVGFAVASALVLLLVLLLALLRLARARRGARRG